MIDLQRTTPAERAEAVQIIAARTEYTHRRLSCKLDEILSRLGSPVTNADELLHCHWLVQEVAKEIDEARKREISRAVMRSTGAMNALKAAEHEQTFFDFDMAVARFRAQPASISRLNYLSSVAKRLHKQERLGHDHD